MYTSLEQIKARIPADLLTQALSDSDGVEIDEAIWLQVYTAAALAIDGAIGGRYSTPLAGTIPAVIQDAACTFCCELIYQRRGVPPEQNPWSAHARECRQRLIAIGAGTQPLSVSSPKARPAGSIVSQPSRLGSNLLV